MNPQNKSTALSADLNNFIYGVSRRNFQNAPELTKIGISLLKNFPAARDAVLEYFAMIFREAVNVSVNQSEYENDPSSSGSLESVSMIGSELCVLTESQNEWAPFIAPWCIKLIMDIATDKANLPSTMLQSLDAVRVLLDITTQNLMLLNTDERAKCIDMMLDSRVCSWAVGWVGRLQPALVAPRALALPADAARAALAALAAHPPALPHVRAALNDLFQEAIREDSADRKKDVIPYLLNLASKSDIVLKALTQDIEQTLTDEAMSRLCAVCARYRNSPAWEAAGAAQLVALLLRADANCLLLLLRHATRNLFCRQLLEYLLLQLESESLTSRCPPLAGHAATRAALLRERMLTSDRLHQYSLARVLVIVCYNLPSEFVNTISFFLQHSRDDTTLALLVRIISGTISMHTPNDSQDINMNCDRYQEFIKTGVERAMRDAVMSDEQIKRCFIEGNVPEDRKTYLHYYCLNIIKLLRWENSGRVQHLRDRRVARAVESCLYSVAGALKTRAGLLQSPGAGAETADTYGQCDQMPTCHALAEVIDRVDLAGAAAAPPGVHVIIRVVQATVKYFFRCLHQKDTLTKVLGGQRACRVLRAICAHSKLARAVALRELLETAMFREESAFGSHSARPPALDYRDHHLLIHLNQKHGPITQLTQSHTSVFHAGIIGRGARREPAGGGAGAGAAGVPPALTANNELLMGALMCCMQEGNNGIVEGATSIALLLVELVSPDVMYNGLPWPDEDFTKQVSIERELYMVVSLERCAVSRAALRRCARARPSLCLASALLRAPAATLLHRLRAHLDRHSGSEEMARSMAALHELLGAMALGQLLPPPLSHMDLLAPSLTASEIVQMLRDCLWNYTRDHVPSPALFTCDATGLRWRDPSTCKPAATYTDTLRLIIQKRIAKLGHVYPIMFLNLEKAEH